MEIRRVIERLTRVVGNRIGTTTLHGPRRTTRVRQTCGPPLAMVLDDCIYLLLQVLGRDHWDSERAILEL
mgnify:CR=1 FL=1